MKSIHLSISWCLFFSICVTGVSCSGYNDVQNLQRELLANYTPNIRPLINQSEAITVYADFGLISILSFDERAGILKTLCFMAFSWIDEKIRWNSSNTNIKNIRLPLTSVWVPQIFFQNSATEQMNIDSKSGSLLYFSNGTALNVFGGFSTTRCDANLLYYPFDKHSCDLQVISWLPDDKLVMVSTDFPYAAYEFENKEWRVLNVRKRHSMLAISNNHSLITFTVEFQRRPAFYILNILSPIPCLGFLNIFVFKLPVSSGERVSFSLTILLTLVFFLNMIADTLPPVAEPISLYNIMVMLVLQNSVFIGICVILSSMTYEKINQNSEVPEKLRKWTALLLALTKTTNKIDSVKMTKEAKESTQVKIDEDTAFEEKSSLSETITWEIILQESDKLYIRLFSLLFISEWLIYIILTIINI